MACGASFGKSVRPKTGSTLGDNLREVLRADTLFNLPDSYVNVSFISAIQSVAEYWGSSKTATVV